jgi:hypothetical protein
LARLGRYPADLHKNRATWAEKGQRCAAGAAAAAATTAVGPGTRPQHFRRRTRPHKASAPLQCRDQCRCCGACQWRPGTAFAMLHRGSHGTTAPPAAARRSNGWPGSLPAAGAAVQPGSLPAGGVLLLARRCRSCWRGGAAVTALLGGQGQGPPRPLIMRGSPFANVSNQKHNKRCDTLRVRPGRSGRQF